MNMNKLGVKGFTLLIVLCASGNVLAARNRLRQWMMAKPGEITQHGSYVIQKILSEMGLTLDEADKRSAIDEEKLKPAPIPETLA